MSFVKEKEGGVKPAAEATFAERIRAWMKAEVTESQLKPGRTVDKLWDGSRLKVPFKVVSDEERKAFADLLTERLGKKPDLSRIVFATGETERMAMAGVGGYAKEIFCEGRMKCVIVVPEIFTKALMGDDKARNEAGELLFNNYAVAYREEGKARGKESSFYIDLMNGEVADHIDTYGLMLPYTKELLDAMDVGRKTSDYRLLAVTAIATTLAHEYLHAEDFRAFEERERKFREETGALLTEAKFNPSILAMHASHAALRFDAAVDRVVSRILHPKVPVEVPIEGRLVVVKAKVRISPAGIGYVDVPHEGGVITTQVGDFRTPPKQALVGDMLNGVYLASELKRRGIDAKDSVDALQMMAGLVEKELDIRLPRDAEGGFDAKAIATRFFEAENAFFANPTKQGAEEFAKMDFMARLLGIDVTDSEPYAAFNSSLAVEMLTFAKAARSMVAGEALKEAGEKHFKLYIRNFAETAQFQILTEAKAHALMDREPVINKRYPLAARHVSMRLRFAAEKFGEEAVMEKVEGITDLAELMKALKEMGLKETREPAAAAS